MLDARLLYLAYSPTLIQTCSSTHLRKGKLEELGGRVVQIRQRFEVKERANNETLPPQPKAQNSQQSTHRYTIGLNSGPSDSHTATEAMPSSSSAFYSHSNNDISYQNHKREAHPSKRSSLKPPNPGTKAPPHPRPTSTLHISTPPKPSSSSNPPSYRSAGNLDLSKPPAHSTSLYSILHPSSSANPEAFRQAMSQETRRRLKAAADEVDFRDCWKNGRESELVRKMDYAWEWKRFSDTEWNERERERCRGKGKGKEREKEKR